jgi:hypothetical protein
MGKLGRLSFLRDDARLVGCDQVRLDRREFRSANCRWKAISFHARLRRQCSISSPIPRSSTPRGYEHVGQALRFCLSDLVIIKAVPARTCAALGLDLGEQKPIKDWSLTSLKEKLIKIGAKVVSHGRYVVFQMAEVAIPRQMFQEILRLIAELRPQPPPAPA